MASIREARSSDRPMLAEMRRLLWPNTSPEELGQELDAALSEKPHGTLPCKILVAHEVDGTLIGFLDVGLRSHADGCDVLQPAGYVEGWFVRDRYRQRGIGSALMRAAEDWARAQGCREMASDALIDNEESQRAHEALGFDVVDRCVHFRKEL